MLHGNHVRMRRRHSVVITDWRVSGADSNFGDGSFSEAISGLLASVLAGSVPTDQLAAVSAAVSAVAPRFAGGHQDDAKDYLEVILRALACDFGVEVSNRRLLVPAEQNVDVISEEDWAASSNVNPRLSKLVMVRSCRTNLNKCNRP